MMLEGKVVVVTGGARGMGRAYVEGFLAEGAKVVAIDQSWDPSGFSGDRDDAYYQELKSRSDGVLTLTCDIADPAQVEAAYKAAMQKFGTADVLVNNAGARQRDLFPPSGRITTLETKRSHWERMFGVTVFGTLDLAKLFIQPMIQKRSGSIISVISGGRSITLVVERTWLCAQTAVRYPTNPPRPLSCAQCSTWPRRSRSITWPSTS